MVKPTFSETERKYAFRWFRFSGFSRASRFLLPSAELEDDAEEEAVGDFSEDCASARALTSERVFRSVRS